MSAKEFDCVQMKHEIQQRILAEFCGLSPQERRQRTEQMIQQDPLLARLWRQARRTRPAAPTAQAS
jgi:hypothetical protein